MIRGETKNGFAFAIPDDIFDDFELVELFSKVDKNPIYLGDLMAKLLGEEQKKALVEHLRRDGKVRTSDMMAALSEIEDIISEKAKEPKN